LDCRGNGDGDREGEWGDGGKGGLGIGGKGIGGKGEREREGMKIGEGYIQSVFPPPPKKSKIPWFRRIFVKTFLLSRLLSM